MYYGTEIVTFVGPRIWEIVSDYIEERKSLEKFKLKIKLWKSENCPQIAFLITCLLNLYAIMSYFHFVF